jgi:hypothetical protein
VAVAHILATLPHRARNDPIKPSSIHHRDSVKINHCRSQLEFLNVLPFIGLLLMSLAADSPKIQGIGLDLDGGKSTNFPNKFRYQLSGLYPTLR